MFSQLQQKCSAMKWYWSMKTLTTIISRFEHNLDGLYLRRWWIYCSDWSRWFISVVWVVRVARVVPIVFPEAANTFSRRDFENWTNTHKVSHQCCETMEPMLETMEQTQNSDPKWLQSPFCCLAHTAHITDIEQYSIDVWSLTRQPPAPALAE